MYFLDLEKIVTLLHLAYKSLVAIVKMRILLIVSNIDKGSSWESAPEPPLGVAYIAAYLEEDNQVKIIDNFLEKRQPTEIIKNIRKFEPDVVGLSITTFTINESLALAKLIKHWNKDIKIVAGGAHPTLFPQQILESPDIDAVVIGEGELTMKEYVNILKSEGNLRKVNGLAYKKEGRLIINSPREHVKNLDKLKFPAWHLLKIKDYPEFQISTNLVSPVMNICSSRGCPYQCLYCSSPTIWGRNWRGMSGKRIVSEIQALIKKYNINSIKFHEDHFTLNRNRVIDFCKELAKKGINIEWQCEARVNNVDPEMLKKMKKAGCKIVWFGIESGSQKILDFYRKDTNLQQIRNAIKMVKAAEIRPMGSFILGAPIETEREMKKTIRFGLNLGLEEIYFNVLVAIPGTDLYKYVIKNKLIHRKIGEVVEVSGVVSRARVIRLRSMAQKRVILHKIIKLWKRFLVYYISNPRKFLSNRLRRNIIFLLK